MKAMTIKTIDNYFSDLDLVDEHFAFGLIYILMKVNLPLLQKRLFL